MTLLQSPIRQIAMIFASAARATSSGGRLFEVLDLKAEIADVANARDLTVTKGVLRFEHVDFAYDRRQAGAARHHLRGGARQDPGHRRPARVRQVDHRQPHSALLRRHRRADDHRRPGRPRGEPGLVAPARRPRAAGSFPVRRHGDQQHRLRRSLGRGGAHRGRPPAPPRSTTMWPPCRRPTSTRVGERGVALSGGQRQRMSIARGVVPGPG